MSLKYLGQKNCELTHGPSGVKIQTDAPVDNHGRGQSFSPTDLMTVSLATCAMTIMAIQLEPEGHDLKNTQVKVIKHMVSNPRRIGQIDLEFSFENKFLVIKDRILNIINNCPVHKSIHPDIKVNIKLNFN